jgi:hypothetical protein
LRTAEVQSADELAKMLEPLAKAMAALTDETRQTLAQLDKTSKDQSQTFKMQLATTVQSYNEASKAASSAADKLAAASSRIEMSHYALAVVTGLVTAVLTTAFWLWLAPPKINNTLDAQAVAQVLKPAVIEALRPSKGR